MKTTSIYASLLAIEKGNTPKEWKRVERFVDGAHIDVMDGKFVLQKTRFTPAFVRSLRTKKVKDVHLMVQDPERYVAAYVRAGAQKIDIHFEILRTSLTSLRDVKMRFPWVKVFLAINPETSARAVFPYLPLVHGVLCMTVHPGLGGQKFIGSVLRKIRAIRKHAPHLPIMIDGGVNERTAILARKAGATILVSGSYIFRSPDPLRAVRALKTSSHPSPCLPAYLPTGQAGRTGRL